MHSKNPPKAGNQRTNGDCNAKQMMWANVANEILNKVEDNPGAFNVIASLNISADTRTQDPTKHIEVYDSGATCHMSPYIDEFLDFTFIEPKPISAADNRTFKAVGKGTMKIIIPNGDNSTIIHLKDVLYAPSIAFTLISLSQADSAGYTACQEIGLVAFMFFFELFISLCFSCNFLLCFFY